MGRTGVTGRITRAPARLSNTPELLAGKLKGILPEGVTETDTEFIFNGVRLNKNGLRELEGKLYSDNPFETRFYDEFGKEENDAYYKKYGDYVPAMAFTFDPETKVLTLDGWKVIQNPAWATDHRRTQHASQVAAYGEGKEYDHHVKGWYNAGMNHIGVALDRHLPRSRSSKYRQSKGEEENKFNMIFDTLENFGKFLSLNTKVTLGEWYVTEGRVKYGKSTGKEYTEYVLSDFSKRIY